MTKAQLIEKLLIIDEGNQFVFEQLMAISAKISEYELTIYKYERALTDILDELGVKNIHDEIAHSDF